MENKGYNRATYVSVDVAGHQDRHTILSLVSLAQSEPAPL